MIVTRLAAACCAAMFLSACHPAELFRVEPLSVRQVDLEETDANSQVAKRHGTLYSINLDQFALKAPGISKDGIKINAVSTKEERDAWIAFLLDRSERQCDYHKASIIATQSSVNGILGGTAGLLGGAGAIVTGATAARIFSGSSGAVTGLRAQYNETFYQNLIASAVVRQINQDRKSKRDAIIKSMEKNEKQYTMNSATMDIGEYHDLCSFYVGLVALTSDTQKFKTLNETLQIQVKSAKEAITSLKSEIAAEQTAFNQAAADSQAKSLSQGRLEILRRSLQNQETILASLEAQSSIAGGNTK